MSEGDHEGMRDRGTLSGLGPMGVLHAAMRTGNRQLVRAVAEALGQMVMGEFMRSHRFVPVPIKDDQE